MDWRDFSTAPQDESTFLAAVQVYNNVTRKHHWDYALMYFCEGQFKFADEADTGWSWDDYTHWTPISKPTN
jgi:hypothetical protein